MIGSPFENIKKQLGNNETISSLSQMLDFLKDDPENFEKFEKMPYKFRFKNSQSWDFNINKIRDITRVLKEFDLVIILERFAESLIILKQILCMESTDISPWLSGKQKTNKARNKYKNKESKFYNFTEINDEQLKFMKMKLLDLDLALYDQANKLLDKQIKKYGVEKMKKDVENLMNYNSFDFSQKRPDVEYKMVIQNYTDLEKLKYTVFNYSQTEKFHGSCHL